MKLFPFSGRPSLPIYTDTPPYYVDRATTNVVYIAWLSQSGGQTIMKIDKTADPHTLGFAYGTWANRASLTYVDWVTYSEAGTWEE
jgi:hypothetical protein